MNARTQDLYARRRQRLLERMPPSSVAVFPATPVARRNHDVDHGYRQHSDVYYLTGFVEPEAVVLLMREGDESRFELVVRPRDREREIWDGRRAGVEGAVARYGADEAHPVEALDKALEAALSDRRVLVYALGEHPEMDRRVLDLLARFRAKARKGPEGPVVVQDPAPLLHELRLFKDADEIACLQRAADITVEAHKAAMRAARPGLTERQIQAVVEGTFQALGAERVGYGSIVAGGVNATILHYTENDQPLPADGLLLIDAGAESGYYTADITRTFPVSGRFTEPQREIYELVLKAQLACIEATVPGRSLDEIHEIAVRILTEGLVELGLLEGPADARIEDEGYKRFYMHRTGHWLGMDVHDVGAYRVSGESRRLEPGMVTTVEPGIYVAEDDEEAPARYRGIGVRIEDDVLVTDGPPRVLTAGCPKTVRDIEALMAEPAPAFPAVS